jgi:hypothetical protein
MYPQFVEVEYSASKNADKEPQCSTADQKYSRRSVTWLFFKNIKLRPDRPGPLPKKGIMHVNTEQKQLSN